MSEKKYLNATQAARRMGITPKEVAALCHSSNLKGASQGRKNGPWIIPIESIDTWISKNKGRRKWSLSSLQALKKTGPALLAIVAVLGLISVTADFGGARKQLQEWGILRAFPAAAPDEILVIVASFHVSEGNRDSEVHNEIQRALAAAATELEFTNLRIEIEPRRIMATERDKAKRIGERYDANMIIWGEDTGVRVTVNFLNLNESDFTTAFANITETERTQLANPDEYAQFVTEDLPSQLAFISLYAIGRTYDIGEEFGIEKAIDAVEAAVQSLDLGKTVTDGADEAYHYLGWLYMRSGLLILTNTADRADKISRAINAYSEALNLNANFIQVYYDRAFARQVVGDLQAAIADYNQYIEVNPGSASAYVGRALVWNDLGDLDAAIIDYSQAIEIDPDSFPAYNNRAHIWRELGDLDAAIADYQKAIELDQSNSDRANLYNSLASIRRDQGDREGALDEYNKAIENDPDNPIFYFNRGVVHRLLGNRDAALSDFRRSLYLRSTTDPLRPQIEGWIAELEAEISEQ